MEVTVRLDYGARLELKDIGVAADDGKIAFSIDGVLLNIDDETLEALTRNIARPIAITFEVDEE